MRGEWLRKPSSETSVIFEFGITEQYSSAAASA